MFSMYLSDVFMCSIYLSPATCVVIKYKFFLILRRPQEYLHLFLLPYLVEKVYFSFFHIVIKYFYSCSHHQKMNFSIVVQS